MVERIQLLRSVTPGSRPTGRQYGEPYFNLGDNQFGVFDSSNVARDLIGVPYFSANVNYNAGQPVNYQGKLYIALVSIVAAAWNLTQWSQVTGGGGVAKTQVFTANGTYTPSANLVSAIVEVVGGGGAGGGSSGTTNSIGGGGGGSGGYSRRALTAAQIGSSQSVTIGSGGTGAVNATGGSGTATSFGTLCVANGGVGGGVQSGGSGASVTGAVGDIAAGGSGGGAGSALSDVSYGPAISGAGGTGPFGGGGFGLGSGTSVGDPGKGYGAGGGGGRNVGSGAASAGGNGSPGVCIVTEYVH
jgi:hypothetical protein